MDREDLEQVAAGARDLARVARAVFNAYVEMGFDSDQALELTIAWQDSFLRGDFGG